MMPFQELYNCYFKRIYAYILLRVKDPVLAEDLCAATWRKAYEKINSFEEEKGTFGQWVFTIARNEVNMHRRLYWVKNIFSITETEDLLTSGDKPILQEMEENEFRKHLFEALDKLSARERDLISLKFYSGLNNRQIAGVTGLSQSNVGTILSRALHKMKQQMEIL